MQKLLSSLKSYSSVIIYTTACLLLFVGLMIQFYGHYSAQDENAKQALKINQRYVIDIERILFSKPVAEKLISTKPTAQKISDLPLGSPEIAIILTDLGQDKEVIDSAFRLPPEIAVSFSPYTVDLYEQSRIAATLGHPVFIDLPLEVAGKDMGKFAITSRNNAFRNLQNMEAIFSKPKSVQGVVTPVDENFSTASGFRMVMDILAEKNLTLVYSGLNKEKILKDAENSKVKLARTPQNLADASKLEELEKNAIANGYALGIITATPQNIKAIDEWQKTLIGKKIRLVIPSNE